MRYYPINLDLHGRSCLVVGGGRVGFRKVNTLCKCGAKVTVISPKVCSKILDMEKEDKILIKHRIYYTSDIINCFLVIGASNNKMLNHQVSVDAKKYNVLCNIVDKPEICNFILPAIVNRGDFVLSVSTSGKSPSFAKKVRQDLEIMFGPECATLLKLMGIIRLKLLSEKHDPEQHKYLFEKLIQSNLLNLIKKDSIEMINSVLYSVLGSGYEYKKLLKLK